MLRLLAIITTLVITARMAVAQPLDYTFQKVTAGDGAYLNGIMAIGQDKYGYIWLATNVALNRYDGHGVKVFEHVFNDSTSLLPSQVRCIFNDSEGRMWIGFMHGLMEYDFESGKFKSYATGQLFWVWNILEKEPGKLLVGTEDGLAIFDTHTGAFRFLGKENKQMAYKVRHMALHKGKLYILADTGLIRFDLQTEKAEAIPLPGWIPYDNVQRIAITGNGDIWLGTHSSPAVLYKTDTTFSQFTPVQDLSYAPNGVPNIVMQLYVDSKQRFWTGSSLMGLSLYDPVSKKFRSAIHTPRLSNSICSNFITRVFEDKDGVIWVGSSDAGVCFFHPESNFFRTVLPGAEQENAAEWLPSRTAAETPDGRLWLGTISGLVEYNLETGRYKTYRNTQGGPMVLHDNHILSLCVDRKGNLWIGTGAGLNLLRAGSDRIEFWGEKEGVPQGRQFAILEDRTGTMWFGTTSDGTYFLPPGEKKARSIREHPVLKPHAGLYGRHYFEDSRGRIWFGLDGRGLVYYDPVKQTTQRWERDVLNDTTLAGNFVLSLTEDHNGIIWAGTSNGLSAIDPNTFRFTNFDKSRGLPTNRVSSVLVDRQNRIWIGSASGLVLMDGSRKHTRVFNVYDGLPTNEFSQPQAYRMRNGKFLFATQRGFVLFDPDRYQPFKSAKEPLLTNIKVFNEPFPTQTNYEALPSVYFPPGKNFFSLEFTSLDYRNQRQTWYAYKMEPYDKDWTYTKEPVANYTNVPAGRYEFLYKTTTNPENWNVPTRTLEITVGVHWYLSKWFWGTLAFIAFAGAGWAYSRRLRYNKALLTLERKAQALAKEKALVQYENLTQQLNPHFLFNSLASLSSLIRFDAQQAGAFLDALSKMYRYILQSREHETVTLQSEVDFARNFVHLQKTRFGEALQVNFQIQDQLKDHKIVPVTLQNLMENAIKHNSLDEEDPLRIEVYTEAQYLVVRNNLQRRPMVETSNRQGLDRLRTLYSYLSSAPLLIEDSGDFFTVKVPLL